MATIELQGITKTFGKKTALDKLDLKIKDKEFFVLFGPAGAGKTTILKTIAGIEFPDRGHVLINNEVVNLIEPAQRNVSMVFENYALYPHITVFENIASPMRSPLHKTDDATITKKVHEVAAKMKIDQLMERLPSQLSNGQRQRVALGRCLVRDPNVFLMDEPLAHLDAKLRHFMRAELKEMQASFNTTTIYVTHDYLEALSLGDRIAIINLGKIEQLGTGDEIYYAPANEFVAKLVGEPEINLFDAVVDPGFKKVTIFDQSVTLAVPDQVQKKLKDGSYNRIRVGLRATDIHHSMTRTPEAQVSAKVFSVEPIGNKAILVAQVGLDHLIQVIAANDFTAPLNADLFLHFKMENALFFDAGTKKLIGRQNQDELTRQVK